jgi:hypothetical protein
MNLLRKPSPDAPTTPPVTKPPALETAQGNLAAGAVQAGRPDRDAALACLVPHIAATEAGLAMREAWHTSPVTPKPDVDDFPAYESVDTLLKHAVAQHADAYPAWEEFVTYRKRVLGHVEAIATTRAALARIPKLQSEDCSRPEHFRVANRWPTDSLVERLQNTMGGMRNVPRDTLDDHARALATSLTQLLAWSRSSAAAVRPTLATTRNTDDRVSDRITQFNVFDHR